jgi:hypothetical protein
MDVSTPRPTIKINHRHLFLMMPFPLFAHICQPKRKFHYFSVTIHSEFNVLNNLLQLEPL